jgi:hypothetical protein
VLAPIKPQRMWSTPEMERSYPVLERSISSQYPMITHDGDGSPDHSSDGTSA